MLRRLLPALLLAATLSFFASCGGSSSGSGTSGPAYPACETDSHCAAQNQVCVNGMCAQCRDSSQCAGDPCGVCGANHTCEARRGCCRTGADCSGGMRCVHTPGQQGGVCR